MNSRGQFHIMEAITAMMLITTAMAFMIPVEDNSGDIRDHEPGTDVNHALRTLASMPPRDARYSSFLDEIICKNNISGLIIELDSLLYDNICFNIYLSGDMDEDLIFYLHQPPGTTSTATILVYLSGGRITTSDGVMIIDQGMYRLKLLYWNEPRCLDEMLQRVGQFPDNDSRDLGGGYIYTPPEGSSGNNTISTTGNYTPVAILTGGIIVLILAGVIFIIRRSAMLSFTVPAYSRLKEEDILETTTREEIYEIIKSHPGITYSEILSKSGLGRGTVLYHTGVLEKEGIIRSWKEGKHRRFAPNGVRVEPLVPTTALRMIEYIEEHPGCTISEISSAMGISRQAVHRHVIRLSELGYIKIEHDGRRMRIFIS